MQGKEVQSVEGRSVPWAPETGGGRDLEAAWDQAAEGASRRPYLDPETAALKRRVHLELLARWLPDLRGKRILKTDLWEEGVTGDELLIHAGAPGPRGARGRCLAARG